MATRILARHALVAALVISGSSSVAFAAPITSLVVYGDSLSDNGNLFAATGQPPAPYYFGRLSNGPVAVEYLAVALGVPLVDFAWAGATTGIGNSVDLGTATDFGAFGLPGMQTVFAATKGLLAPHLADGLFVVWGGPNDFSSPSVLDSTPADIINRAVTNLLSMVASLQGLGAQHILVPGMPDLGLIPESQAIQSGPHRRQPRPTRSTRHCLPVFLPACAILIPRRWCERWPRIPRLSASST